MNIYAADKKEVNKLFRVLETTRKELHDLCEANNLDAFYAKEPAFKDALNSFIRSEGAMSLLSTKQLLMLCSWVGTFRPMALHSFFIYCDKNLIQ